MIAPIPPIHRMARLSGMGAMRLMGCHQPRAARDAESAEVLGNIKHALSLSNGRSLSLSNRALL
jgi:hypothetical protein